MFYEFIYVKVFPVHAIVSFVQRYQMVIDRPCGIYEPVQFFVFLRVIELEAVCYHLFF